MITLNCVPSLVSGLLDTPDISLIFDLKIQRIHILIFLT
jgi:hypothetical protein